MKLFYWVFVAALAVIAVLFALSNRQTVSLGLWPLPFTVTAIPLYAVALGTFVAGFFCGGIFVWLRSLRRRANAVARRAAPLEREVDELRDRLGAMEQEAATVQDSDRDPPPKAIALGR